MVAEYGVSVDADGYYRIEGFPDGAVEVMVNDVGNASHLGQLTAELYDGQTTRLDISLVE